MLFLNTFLKSPLTELYNSTMNQWNEFIVIFNFSKNENHTEMNEREKGSQTFSTRSVRTGPTF